jgi:hypothetical protein
MLRNRLNRPPLQRVDLLHHILLHISTCAPSHSVDLIRRVVAPLDGLGLSLKFYRDVSVTGSQLDYRHTSALNTLAPPACATCRLHITAVLRGPRYGP